MAMTRFAGMIVLGAMVLGGVVGCESGPSMGRYNVEVSLDPSLASRAGGPPQIMVDLVGLNDTQVAAWESKSMTSYWTTADPLRAEAKDYRKEMPFGPGQTAPQTLSKSDAIWNKWKERGAMHLFVLADLPGAKADAPGTADGRRVILPLDKRRWKTDTIKIVVQNSQLNCTTPPEPPK